MIRIYIICLVMSAFAVYAQVPNNSFEEWTSSTPNGWFTTNVQQLVTPISQSTDSYSGKYAVKGEVRTGPNGEIILPGMFSGSFGQGFEVTQRHPELRGQYKFSSVGGDVLTIVVLMYSGSDFVGGGVTQISNSTSGYQQFNVPISYSFSNTPDNCIIEIAARDTTEEVGGHVGTWFLVDDIKLDNTTSIEDQNRGNVAENFILNQNYPNPFNPSTTIEFSIKEDADVTFQIYNSLGEEVATIINNERLTRGSHRIQWNAGTLANGVYVYRLTSKNFTDSKKMILLK